MNKVKEQIGIIGLGFVGNAVLSSYRDMNGVLYDVLVLDTDPAKSTGVTYDDLKNTSGIFVCVPSPSAPDGSCDASILVSVLENLKDYKGVIISKVTATPDIYEKLQVQYPNLVHVPEFLTAANAVQDYLGSKFSIIGGSVKAWMNEADRIIRMGDTAIEHSYFCTIGEASLAKYTINSFLATKVVFMNEMARLAKLGGQNWNTVRDLIALDDRRIGNSHTQVPGPDGHYGFGGYCFPKDTLALLRYAESMDNSLNVLDSAVKKNLLLRLTDSK